MVEITVKDNRDEQATIRVTVIPRVMSMEVTEIYPHIEYIDNEKGIEVEEEVKKRYYRKFGCFRGVAFRTGTEKLERKVQFKG